ncbi:MAG: acyltransferase [Anaerolineales bacterium]
MKFYFSKIEQTIQRIKRDSSYKLDRDMRFVDLISLIRYRFVDYFRGCLYRIKLGNAGKNLFIGRHVRIKHPKKVFVGSGVSIDSFVMIDALSTQGVTLGDNVSIGAFTIIKVTGIISDLGVGFIIGDNSNLGQYCFVGAAGGVKIGNNVLIGQRVSFHSENHIYHDTKKPIKEQGTNRKGIEIHDDCWIGGSVTILDGVIVNKGSVIAAGSVLINDVPPYTVVGGVPARVIIDRLENVKNEE